MSTSKERESEIMDMILEILRKHKKELTGYHVWLFGSRAARTHKSRSDFDIGVFGIHLLPLKIFFAIDDQFDALPTLYRIDWIDFSNVSSNFREQVMCSKKKELYFAE
jgi:predicted nucleotidyltransferase